VAKRAEITGEWRTLHSEELHDLYCPPNIVRVIKFRRMRWVGNVELMEERRFGVWDFCIHDTNSKKY
jgi:hypothetical protein